MGQNLFEVSKIAGLEFNLNKTKYMSNNLESNIIIDKENIEKVNDYVYLGHSLSFGGEVTNKELTRRRQRAWSSFWALREI